MASPQEELLTRLLRLPTSERAQLAKKLLASLHDERTASSEEAWLDEIERRIDEVSAGTAKVESWSTVKAKVLARLRERRR